LSELVSRYLESNGFCVAVTHRGDQVMERVLSQVPDLVILDLGLPGQDGFSVCRQLRTCYENPLLILTARDNDGDHVFGLELGADDYVIKPVEPRVLMARIHALLRRSRTPRRVDQKLIRFGRLSINTASRSVHVDGRAIALSGGEFDLLVHLAAHAGEVQSRETIFQQLYRREYDGMDRTLDLRISQLRRKLGDETDSSPRIKTVWGQGYLFVPDAW
jgi:two-component system OmpR family response regulator/two-component system response regulator RstA